jgi:hypothetical protein
MEWSNPSGYLRWPLSPWDSALRTVAQGEQHVPERRNEEKGGIREVVLG